MPTARPALASTAPRLATWQPLHRRRSRVPAVAAALVPTLAALWALWAPPSRHLSLGAPDTSISWLRLLPLPQAPAAAEPPEAPAAPAVPSPAPAPNRPALARSKPRAVDTVPSPADPALQLAQDRAGQSPPQPTQPQPISRPAAPASAASSAPTLQLGDDVMRRAARDSIAETRRLAAEAGLPAERDASERERLADAVEQAGKPDCLSANAGGSLLSIPWIALQARKRSANDTLAPTIVLR